MRWEIHPDHCGSCDASLRGAEEHGRQRRQIVDIQPVPPPKVTEYQRISKVCPCCGTVTVPGWDDKAVPVEHADIVAAHGSPVRIGPETLARAALLTCAHYLPIGRARDLLEKLCAIDVSTGFLAGIRGRAARKLEKNFLAHMQTLLAGAPVLHADETTGRAAGSLAYVHVACTEYLTLMHVGGRSSDDIDAGGVLPAFSGVLVRDGYAGYEHLTQALHAWCAAHLLRDLRSISDADPDGQLRATAMANTLLEAHHAAREARDRGATALDAVVLTAIRNHYRGALARGRDDNRGKRGTLAADARTLIRRFHRYEDMIMRFATDLTVPFTNNVAAGVEGPVDGDAVDRDQRPVDDHVSVALAFRLTECGSQLGRPPGEQFDRLVDIPPARGGRDFKSGTDLGERFALTQIHQHRQRLLAWVELAPYRTQLSAVDTDEVGHEDEGLT